MVATWCWRNFRDDMAEAVRGGGEGAVLMRVNGKISRIEYSRASLCLFTRVCAHTCAW